MTENKRGWIGGEMFGLLIAAVMLGGLLIYGALSGEELPLWPAVTVTLVNIVAAARVVVMAQRRKKQIQADKR